MPADADQNHVDRKLHPFDIQHGRPFISLNTAVCRTTAVTSLNATEPFVDRGYKGCEVDQVQIWHSEQRRGVTRGLKAMILRRSPIEPMIGYMKSDGKLGRNWLKGAFGDAPNAVLCGPAHDLRLIINKLRGACQPSPTL